jgi:hypothetical protein
MITVELIPKDSPLGCGVCAVPAAMTDRPVFKVRVGVADSTSAIFLCGVHLRELEHRSANARRAQREAVAQLTLFGVKPKRARKKEASHAHL